MPQLRRYWPYLLAAVLAVVQVGGSFGASRGQPDRQSIDAVAVLLLLVGPVSLLACRRWPLAPAIVAVAAACVYIGLGYPFGPIFATVVAGFFLAVQRLPRRVMIPLATVAVVVMLVVVWTEPRSDGFGWVHVVVVVGWFTAVFAVADIVRVRRDQMRERRETRRIEHERRLADQRVGLARELHDVLGHNISLINVQASTALHLIETQPERASEALGHIKAASADALDELRAALDVLRSGGVDGSAPHTPAPRLGELGELVDGVRAGGLNVDLDIDGDPVGVPSPVGLAAYRIAQEALTNVTRHSTANTVTIIVTIGEAAVDLQITDDGRTASPPDDEHREGRGIIGMRERATALGGMLQTGPTATGGFRVAAHLPIVRSTT